MAENGVDTTTQDGLGPGENHSPHPGLPLLLSEPVTVSPSKMRRPRIWTAVTVGLLTPLFGLGVSSIVLIIALLQGMSISEMQQRENVETWVSEFVSSPKGLIILVIPAQLTFLLVAVGAAALSPQSLESRLAIRRSAMPIWTYPVLVLATLGAGVIGSLTGLLFERTDDGHAGNY